jgi:hypothetical protein
MVIIVMLACMKARVLREDENEITIEVSLRKSSAFLECEENIQDAANEFGKLATERCLESCDSDGSPIRVAGRTLTAKKAKVARNYNTPYGVVTVERHLYQSSAGGSTYCPLDHAARIFASTTPRYARMVSSKYNLMNAGRVRRDLMESHRLNASRCFIQDVSELVGDVGREKEGVWNYADSEPSASLVASIAIGIDGTCLWFAGEGNRQAMVGTIALYDAAGERLHTIYVSAAPEFGKAPFLERMEMEIARVRERCSGACFVGVTDGAPDYWPWLKRFTTTQVLDFWHACEYVAQAGAAIVRTKADRELWIESAFHSLKHEHGAALKLLDGFREARANKLGKKTRRDLESAITYLENNLARMNYASYRKRHLPIGSGVTEAACKTIVKERMCGSGMKWKVSGADTVLCLRALHQTQARWDAFWAKISRFGISSS